MIYIEFINTYHDLNSMFTLALYFQQNNIDSPEEINRDNFLNLISYANGYIIHSNEVNITSSFSS